jgi:hypothetical protein
VVAACVACRMSLGWGPRTRGSVSWLRGVIAAKDAEIAVLRAAQEAGQEVIRRLELRLAELERIERRQVLGGLISEYRRAA